MLFVFAVLVLPFEVLFRACTVCLARIVVSICMFGYTCMFFGGVVDLLFTNVFGFVCGFSITITDIFDVMLLLWVFVRLGIGYVYVCFIDSNWEKDVFH